MIKKTLYFGNPAYLSVHQTQLVVKMPEADGLFVLCLKTGRIEEQIEALSILLIRGSLQE